MTLALGEGAGRPKLYNFLITFRERVAAYVTPWVSRRSNYRGILSSCAGA